MEFQAQVRQMGFPDNMQVDQSDTLEGRVFRVTDASGERGLEIFVTRDALAMYGEGPVTALVLGRLREQAGRALRAAEAPGMYERQVFVGD
ncbi:hypothetical protein [Deinococcus hopiensis]|uniref:Uncharacterized protein n=1 Tax=Deinococcus hopiensis KR-140 TaxID=695939 RepID=A0A1W1VLN9_9DEIO|nr:hypothetical protein [Deinococcus hopiensis]SMB94299.1 hypothetical protein SAMN00790413_02330 [Deinococcus hopiensis KR-140]